MSAVYSLSCAGSNGSTLQIDFRRVGDRFVHSIRCIDSDGNSLAVWDGVQKPEAELWPASPPIQELSLETIDGRDVLLGVGRAGKCHWSVSVETVEIDSAAAFRFDIACRCPDPPRWLGSTYQASPDAAEPAGTASTSLAVQTLEDTALSDNGSEQITIQPTVMPRVWPATVRWRYAILAGD